MQQFSLMLLALFFSSCAVANSACNSYFSDEQLINLKARQFQPVAGHDVNHTAITLLACIGHSNPAIRDGVVYEAYQHWLRNAQLTNATLRQLLKALLGNLQHSGKDPSQFRTAFSALILSEVLRADVQQPYLAAAERQRVVEEISQFMTGIRDYRGFTDQEGWRHSVAHTADVILQLSLNNAITQQQGQRLLIAIISQVSPAQHFYHFGEPKRLAMPVLYLLLNDKVDEASLTNQLQKLAQPAPFVSWQAVYQSEQGLAKLHNTRSFFAALYVLASSSQNAKLQTITPALLKILQSMD